MTPAYVDKPSFQVQITNIGAQKNNNSIFKIFEIVLASFQAKIKLNRACFFYQRFLLADINVNVIFGILFLIFSNVDIRFTEHNLAWNLFVGKIKTALLDFLISSYFANVLGNFNDF